MAGGKEEEQDGVSVHSPCKALPSSASSLRKEEYEVELEIRLLEAIAIYPPNKLQGVHRHFVLYGLMEYLRRSFGKQFSSTDVLQLLDRFYDLEMIVCILIGFVISCFLDEDNFLLICMVGLIHRDHML